MIADSVNPWSLTRDAWLDVARRAQVTAAEVEVQCSDDQEHRRRVEQRLREARVSGPTWDEVLSRDYRAWDREHIMIDTADRTVEQSVTMLRAALAKWVVPRDRSP